MLVIEKGAYYSINTRRLLLILAVLVLVVLISPLLMGGVMGPDMMGLGMMWGFQGRLWGRAAGSRDWRWRSVG
jgi:hypothetical protein